MNKRAIEDARLSAIFQLADLNGREAAEKCDVVPMVVQEHANPCDDSSEVKKQWFVSGGVCGFAWVKIRPANSRIAHFAIAKLSGWKRDSYSGGITFWVSAYGQSMQRKEAYANAYARTLNEHGVNAFAESRMD